MLVRLRLGILVVHWSFTNCFNIHFVFCCGHPFLRVLPGSSLRQARHTAVRVVQGQCCQKGRHLTGGDSQLAGPSATWSHWNSTQGTLGTLGTSMHFIDCRVTPHSWFSMLQGMSCSARVCKSSILIWLSVYFSILGIVVSGWGPWRKVWTWISGMKTRRDYMRLRI